MTVTTRGERELTLRFETFPERAHKKLESRISKLIAELAADSQAEAPHKTGQLRSEITPKLYADQPDRVAGYVSVFAPGAPGEYPKAATLEYGSDKVRKIFAKSAGVFGRLNKSRRIVAKLSKPAHIQAFAYLRRPLEEMRPEIEASLDEALAEVTAEANA